MSTLKALKNGYLLDIEVLISLKKEKKIQEQSSGHVLMHFHKSG